MTKRKKTSFKTVTVYKSISKELNGINQSDTCDVAKKCIRETAISKGHTYKA